MYELVAIDPILRMPYESRTVARPAHLVGLRTH